MIIEFLVGLLIGLMTIPICFIVVPCRRKGIPSNDKIRRDNELSANQNLQILKSLHPCTDLHWLNVLIGRFWYELSESQAQAYRLRSFISRYFESISNTGIIKNIGIDEVYMDKEAPVIESICVMTQEEIENLLKESKKMRKNKPKEDTEETIPHKNDLNFKNNSFKEYKSLNSEDIFSTIFKNVNTLLKVNYEGSIMIKMRIDLFNSFSFSIDVYIRKVKGDVLMRLPSLDYNTRLEYAFISPPEFEISVEAGLTRNEGKAYFKETISNFVRRSLKFAVFKYFVYPSFSTLILPLIVPTFKYHTHKLEKVTVHTCEESIIDLRETLSLFLSMDYKIIDSYEGITIRRNNYLINNRDKVTCAHFNIPENALNFSNLETSKNYLYEGLTIRESKIMNLIYDLALLKNVISSFRKTKTIHNFGTTTSLIEIDLTDKTLEYIRIVSKDTIYFQKNDEEDPEFIIFRIANRELFIYSFILSRSLVFTKNRLMKLIRQLSSSNAEKSTVSTIYSLLKLPKEAYKYLKGHSIDPNIETECVEDVSSLTVHTEQPDLLKVFHKYTSTPDLLKLKKVLLFRHTSSFDKTNFNGRDKTQIVSRESEGVQTDF